MRMTTLNIILAIAALAVPLLFAYAIVERLARRAGKTQRHK